jgi:FkbH-like protein
VANLVSDDAADALASGSLPRIRKALVLLQQTQSEQQPFHLSIIRTFTIETQTAAIELALQIQTQRAATVSVADLDGIESELLDSASATYRSRPDAIVALWRLEELHPDFVAHAGQWAAGQREKEVAAIGDRIRSLVQNHARIGTAPLFLSTLSTPNTMLSDATMPFGMSWATSHLNALIFELAASTSNAYVFDFQAWRHSAGSDAYDEKMDLFARQPIARGALGSFASAIARTVAPLIRPSAKVLAVDLDNVLWGGVLGEDGTGGLAIGHEFPGNVHRRIQAHVRALRDRGVLLALVSKNDLAPVRDAFADRPEMLLALDDFSAIRVNWLPKHENLSSIAAELNLGLDSFVFLDDQPYERETVRFHLPQVQVLQCGSDALSILQTLRSTTAFDTLRVGEADRNRIRDYAAQKERSRAVETGDLSDFLHTLELRIDLAPVDASSIDRAHQMLQKTNQFNVTTKRHTRAQLDTMIRDGALALTLSMRDRFGDQGIVGLAIATRSGEQAQIDTFLMSCRALGRGAEQALWAALVAQLYEDGARVLTATYEPTAKNGQVADLFDRLGMTHDADFKEHRRYSASLPLAACAPAWVNAAEVATR